MAHNHTFLIPKLSDKQIVEGLRRSLDESGLPWTNIRANHALIGIHYEFPKEGQANEKGANLLKLGSQVISSFTVTLDSPYNAYSVRVNREGAAAHDSVQLNSGDNHPDRDSQDNVKVAKLQSGLEKELKAFRLQETLGRLLGTELQQHYEEREVSLTRLETLSAKFIEELATRQKEQADALQRAYQDKHDALHESVAKYRTEAEELAKKRSDELEAREAALTKRLSEIDDRDSRHARREIRKEMQKAIQGRAEKFELTKGTRHMRWPMHGLCVALLCAFAWGIWHTLQFGIAGADPWQVAVRQVFLGLGFSSTAVFYIRWLNDWFQQHSREEFKLKRLELDLDRASWVVEMALEWKDEKGTEFPAELVQTLARNLFVDGDAKPESMHPADQLASALLGASSEATVALPGGSSFKLDRKSIGELKKEK